MTAACALLQLVWFSPSSPALQEAMHRHAAFRLQLQQQLLREGSKVQSEHPTQKPGPHEQQRSMMPDSHQREANDPCSCTASSKPLQGSSQQSLFSLAGSSCPGAPPAAECAAHASNGAADAGECSRASAGPGAVYPAAAQVCSIQRTAGCCSLHDSQLLCPDSLLCAQGSLPSTGLQRRAAPHHTAQSAVVSHHWSQGEGGGLHAGKACWCSSELPLPGPGAMSMALLPQGLTSTIRPFLCCLPLQEGCWMTGSCLDCM